MYKRQVFLLRDYLNLRKAERSDWSRDGQQKGTTDDLKAVSKAIIYLKEHELFTLEDLDAALQGMRDVYKRQPVSECLFLNGYRRKGYSASTSES